VQSSPPFGQADLSNCERELIHLAGSVQPHGVLLVLREPEFVVVQATANAAALFGVDTAALLGTALAERGGDLDAGVRRLADAEPLDTPRPLQCHVMRGALRIELEGVVHRHPGGGVIVELEPIEPLLDAATTVDARDPALLLAQLAQAVQRFSSISTIGVLADGTVKVFRDLTGYDRVMVYKFDSDGHGKIIAEARDPRLQSLLGHRYPASDIPQRARELYLRNRVRVLADVHYVPVPLVPPLLPLTGQDLDMSLCHLRSMSPLHTQYLKNMGVAATLVASLVREGRLWGLVAAHHDTPRKLSFAVRAAMEMLAEVVSTRIAAIENYAHAQVAILVRRLEQRLIEATSTEGDWRFALFRNPRTLLQPLEASGAALFHDGEILTSGEVPSTPELRALLQWIDDGYVDAPFRSSSVSRANPALQSLTPLASGVLAVKLSTSRPDYLVWFRKEQLETVTWAGDPAKQLVNDNPLELSPRRSFAAWSELVRGTALPWTSAELALARAIGTSLVDIILQVHAVRLLIAEHQIAQTRATVQASSEPVAVASADGSLLLPNAAFLQLVGCGAGELQSLADVAALFTQPEFVRTTLAGLRTAHQPWSGELALAARDGSPVPVKLRAEVVPGRDGSVLGFILILLDLRERQRASAARRHLEEVLTLASQGRRSGDGAASREDDDVFTAILTNASLAAMDIADGAGGPAAAPLLEELETSTQRAAALYGQIRSFVGKD
jgi:two-component system, chemotaxis family, sensor kinase Cph1